MERGMGLFRRKTTDDDDAVRCPRCRERVPDGASECAMCGRELDDAVARADGSAEVTAAGEA